MSSIFDTVTQSAFNALKYEEIDALLWMITNTGTVNAMDWGTALNRDDPGQVQAWCETVNVPYNPELSGTKMVNQARKLKLPIGPPTVAKPKKPTVPELKAQCKAHGVKGFSKMKRNELEHALGLDAGAADEPEPESEPESAADEPEPESESADDDDSVTECNWGDWHPAEEAE